MKSPLLLVLALALIAAPAGTVLLDDSFSTGNSQIQDLPNNSVWLFNGRTNNLRTDAPGSVTIDMTPAGGSSEAAWAFFTDAGKPVTLGTGDKLVVAVTFSTSGFLANGQDIRFGVLDSLGTRNTTNLAGGMNDATFIGDTGYGVDFYPSGTGNPFVLGRRATLSNANVFNNFGDFATVVGTGASDRQTLADDTPYTLTYTIERLTDSTTQLTTDVSGGNLSGLTFSGIENNSSPYSTFDYFAFRVSGTSFATKLSFSRLFVQFIPSAPKIIVQPQPLALTLQVGSSVSMAVAASGSALTYQWQKDGKSVTGNDSALTPTLALKNLQLADAGSYTAVVTNSGGSVASSPVALKVSTTPVPPAPIITTQPSSQIAVLGSAASLSVQATGAGPLYQWFKNGVLIPGATAATLTFNPAKVIDSGSYTVTISNSSGSVVSSAAQLTVVSAISAIGFFPWPGYTSRCVDGSLSLDFDAPVALGKTGKLRVINSAGKAVDTIDLANNPQTRSIGGTSFSYFPLIVTGKHVDIYFHAPLAYGETYTISADAGVLTDVTGAPWSGIQAADGWTFSTQASGPAPGLDTIQIAQDDSGDFCTVQSGIDYVPSGNTKLVTVSVAPGTYNEINYVTSTKPFIKVQGQDRDSTVIQYSNNANLNQGNNRSMFGVDAPDFTLENITLWNTTLKGGSQAEAFRGNNSRILLNHVNLKSYQDTLLLQGLGLVNDSYIEGDVDFLWGVGTVFVQNSEIKGVSSSGYYTQIRNTQTQNGMVFVNSRLSAPDGVTGMYLARIDPTVFPYSQVAFINSTMGPHIIADGWLLNNATTAPNVQFWEYKSVTPDGTPVDISKRAAFSRQLTDSEAAKWSDPAFVLGGWVPPTVTASLVGSKIVARWTGPTRRSGAAWIGLFNGHGALLSQRAIGNDGTSSGTVVFDADPSGVETRLFLDAAKAASTTSRVRKQ